jgi:hypothetical protein
VAASECILLKQRLRIYLNWLLGNPEFSQTFTQARGMGIAEIFKCLIDKRL